MSTTQRSYSSTGILICYNLITTDTTDTTILLVLSLLQPNQIPQIQSYTVILLVPQSITNIFPQTLIQPFDGSPAYHNLIITNTYVTISTGPQPITTVLSQTKILLFLLVPCLSQLYYHTQILQFLLVPCLSQPYYHKHTHNHFYWPPPISASIIGLP